jgi:hypothetical protein
MACPHHHSQIRAEQRSWESNAWLLPQPALWQGVPLVSTPKRNYTLDQLADFFADIGVCFPRIFSRYADVHRSDNAHFRTLNHIHNGYSGIPHAPVP